MTVDLLNFLLYFNNQKNNSVILYKYKESYIDLLNIFWNLGLIFGYKVKQKLNKKSLVIYTKKPKNLNNLFFFEFISLPSKKVYISYNDLFKLNLYEKGISIYFLSTNVGILEGSQAIKLKLGGELLCKFKF